MNARVVLNVCLHVLTCDNVDKTLHGVSSGTILTKPSREVFVIDALDMNIFWKSLW